MWNFHQRFLNIHLSKHPIIELNQHYFLGNYVVSPFFSEAGSTIASEVVEQTFNPRTENVSANTTISNNTYIGSTFIEPSRKDLFFADSRGRWFIYNDQYQRWEGYFPPNFIVYRTADIFKDSAGAIRANRLW